MSGNLRDYHRYQRFPIYPRRSAGSPTGLNRRTRRGAAGGRGPEPVRGWRGWLRRHLLGALGDPRYRRHH